MDAGEMLGKCWGNHGKSWRILEDLGDVGMICIRFLEDLEDFEMIRMGIIEK